MLHEEITGAIIESFYAVYNALGYGFLEKVYENAMAHELRKRGFTVQHQMPIQVYYDGLMVGEYFADLVVDGKVIVELKAADGLRPEFEAQLLNYLRATEIEVGLVLNFGLQPDFMRRIFTNDRKKMVRRRAKAGRTDSHR